MRVVALEGDGSGANLDHRIAASLATVRAAAPAATIIALGKPLRFRLDEASSPAVDGRR